MAVEKRTDLDWQDVRIFLALARHGSLSAAARTLSLNHTTISRRLRSLENSVGERLVDRRANGYVLTPAGNRALTAASDMEQAAQILGRGLMSHAPKGLVRVNAPPALSIGFLTPRLATLTARYPRLDIDLTPNHGFVSLERHEADIAVRFRQPQDGDVVARLITSVGYGFYGTNEVCRAVEGGAEPVFIGFDEADAHLPPSAWIRRHFSCARLALRMHDQFAQSIAAHSGVGLALLPHYIGRSDAFLRLCGLEPVPPNSEIFLVTRRRDARNAAIRAVVDGLADMFDQAGELFR